MIDFIACLPSWVSAFAIIYFAFGIIFGIVVLFTAELRPVIQAILYLFFWPIIFVLIHIETKRTRNKMNKLT